MSLVFDMAVASAGCAGKLWLGGEAASSDVKLLKDNRITVVLPAASKPTIGYTMELTVLKCLDGTGVVHGDVPLERVMPIIDRVIEALGAGQGVLISCRNGARRSATLAALVILRMTGATVTIHHISAFLNEVRNIVDLNSRAPPSKYRAETIKPLDFLAEASGRVRGWPRGPGMASIQGLALNPVVTPIGFRRVCLNMGFATIPSARQGSESHGSAPVPVPPSSVPRRSIWGGPDRPVEEEVKPEQAAADAEIASTPVPPASASAATAAAEGAGESDSGSFAQSFEFIATTNTDGEGSFNMVNMMSDADFLSDHSVGLRSGTDDFDFESLPDDLATPEARKRDWASAERVERDDLTYQS